MPVDSYIQDIKTILASARQKAYAQINSVMVEAYWQIGKRIVQEEQGGEKRAVYGEELLVQLSKALTEDFGKGFSLANLRNFRQFYISFPDERIRYALRSELTWTHYRLIMRVENEAARNYYMNEAADHQWSSRVLERNINTLYYHRLLSSRNQEVEKPEEINKQSPKDFIKDPYVFEFLNIPEPSSASEKEIETSFITNLQSFLLELGKGFSFVGRQYRISTETSHFYIDLVFYNYILKCFVLFDLKTTKLTHQDIGQMDMYVRLFDELKRTESDNPTIGIILCTEKDETVVRYSVLKGSEQLFATRYMPWLPTEEELIEEIEREKQRMQLE